MTPTGWCPFATRVTIPSGNYQTGNDGTLAVALHIVVGSVASCISHFKDPSSRVSAHFVVGQDGSCTQFVSIHDTAFAQGLNYDRATGQWYTDRPGEGRRNVRPTWSLLTPGMVINRRIISIENEGRPGEPRTAAHMAMLIRLLKWIAEQTRLVYAVGTTLIGHSMLDNVGRSFCPGRAFDLAAIAMAANKPLQPDWAKEWGTAAPYRPDWGIPTTWRDSYRLGRPLGKALADELPAEGQTVQPFERGYILYSPSAGAKVKEW